MKKIGILILIFMFGIVEVNAYSVTKSGFGITDACDYPIISNTETCNADTTYRVGNGETFYIDYNGTKLNGYCIDPGAAGPKTVVEQDISKIADHVEAFKYICEKTEGNEILRQALIKAYSIQSNLGETKYATDAKGTKDAYNKLGSSTKFNSKYDTNGNALTILKEAKELKGKVAEKAVDPTFSNKSGLLILDTPVAGKLIIKGDGKYSILINGVKQSSSSEMIFDVTKAGTYSIKMTEPDCDMDKTVTASVSFEYEKDDLKGTSSSKYNVRYFANETYENVQRLITCEPTGAGENPNCVGNDCKINNTISTSCTAEKCKEPEFVDGSGVCNSDGTTVVTVKEEPNNLDYSGTKCITKLPDATEAILGNKNDYCNIYCSENYSLNLPGPDAKTNGDKNVFINAGSYFTINDSNMKDETTITCYGKMNIDSYKKTLHDARGLVVTAYNELSYLKGYKKALQNATMTDTGCQVTGSYRELYFDGDQIKDRMTAFQPGKDLPSCPVDNVPESDINALTTALNNAISTAEKLIKEASEKWNQCISWSFEDFNKLLNENCSTEIDFVYQFDQCDAKVVKDGEIKVTSSTEKKSTETNPNLYTGICDVSGNLSNCNKQTNNTAYTYINRQETIVQKYKFDNDFTVHFETGKVNCDAKTGDEYSDIYYGFPVSIDASQAQYKYEYVYTGIGHNFSEMSKDKCSMGRFDSLIKEKNNHGCYYDVNSCGDCDVFCEDPTGNNCNLPLCDGECQVACVGGGCILDFNAGFLATYRTMSLNNPFPNTVATISATPASLLAVASTKDYANLYETNWTTEKGTASTEKIETVGENIYNKKPQYSIELTPTVINEIRKYNASQEENGKGYLNSNIKCIDGTNDNYGQCISTFVHKTDEKWKFEINNDLGSGTINISGTEIPYSTEIVTIDGIKVPFIVYPETSKSFVGPAWK